MHTYEPWLTVVCASSLHLASSVHGSIEVSWLARTWCCIFITCVMVRCPFRFFFSAFHFRIFLRTFDRWKDMYREKNHVGSWLGLQYVIFFYWLSVDFSHFHRKSLHFSPLTSWSMCSITVVQWSWIERFRRSCVFYAASTCPLFHMKKKICNSLSPWVFFVTWVPSRGNCDTPSKFLFIIIFKYSVS